VSPEIHPAANIYPLDEEHLPALAEDIRVHGLRMSVELLDGKVIDGRRRLKACEMVSVKPTFTTIATDDPIAYVRSLNEHRRHLTPSQMSMVAARARDYYDAQAKARMVEGGTRGGQAKGVESLPQPSEKARDAAGKAFGVSGRSVDFATRVLERGTEELVKAVDEGRIAVSAAAVVAADPPEEQRAFVAKSAHRKYRPTKDGGEFGATTKREKGSTPSEPESDEIRSRGVGVRRANEAVDCLKRIPKNDSLRARGFQIVTDWIRQNR
jgi:hypothetical protein